jgi:low temperature requirement protein LtrA
LIAIGESIVAIGFGASHLAVDGGLVVAAVLGLGLSACLWWLYFGGDDERAEHALATMPVIRRAHAALSGFGHWHLPMLLGIVTIAAAERDGLGHPFAPLSWFRAAMLGGGVTVFLAGDVLFRRALTIGRGRVRAAAALLAVASLPLGAGVSPVAQIGALVVLLLAVIVVEDLVSRLTT